MTRTINITVDNKLVKEKRDMNIYHHYPRSAHLISYNNSLTIPLRTVTEDDYLHISIVSGPGRLENKCIVNLPSWADFEFSYRGDVTLTHSGDRTLLKIPPGPPTWQLKMTRSISSLVYQPWDRVTIGDD